MNKQNRNPVRRWQLVAFMGALTSLTAMSVDISLPAIPGLARIFDVEVSSTHAVVSLFLLGYALMQPFIGPVSDRIGRKPVLLTGLGIYVIASLACLYAQTADQLYVARFVQGIGGGCGPVLARAILRDCFSGKDAERAMALVMFAMAFGPIIAPVIGGILVDVSGVFSVFVALFVVGTAYAALTLFWFQETASLSNSDGTPFIAVFKAYTQVLGNATAMSHILAGAFIYAALLCYISASPAILIVGFGVPASSYGYYFALSAGTILAGALLNARLLKSFSSFSVTSGGVVSALVGSGLMIIGALQNIEHPLAVAIPAAFVVFGLSIVLPNSTARAMEPFQSIAGTASAAIGSLQIILGLSAGYLTGLFYDGSATPLAFGIGLCCALTALFFGLSRLFETRHPAGEMK